MIDAGCELTSAEGGEHVAIWLNSYTSNWLAASKDTGEAVCEAWLKWKGAK
jgi:hypothetical protein